MVLHSHHHLILHGQPGCLPHCGEDGFAHRECRGSGQADGHRLRHFGLWLNQRVLQGELMLLGLMVYIQTGRRTPANFYREKADNTQTSAGT